MRTRTDRRTSEISAFSGQTDGQRTDRRTYGQGYGPTDIANSTRLLILTKNIYILQCRKRNLLPVKYFSLPVTYSLTNIVYPFTV